MTWTLQAVVTLLFTSGCLAKADCKRLRTEDSSKTMLDYLKHDRTLLERDCVFVAMSRLGRMKGDITSARIVAEFLDYDASERPTKERAVVAARQDRFPAISTLME